MPKELDAGDKLKLWLALFNAKTEEDLAKIEAMGVPVMNEAIEAYRHVSATDEFKGVERLRSLARHNEAAALRHARNEGEKIGSAREREIWQGVVAEQAALVAERDAQVAEKDALIAQLLAQLGRGK